MDEGGIARLAEVGVFHPAHMNEAIWQFRLFERASLDYLGSATADHEPHRMGLWDHAVTEPPLHVS